MHLDKATLIKGSIAGFGAAIAIGVMEWFSVASHYPLAVIPFATSIVLVIGSPDAEPAQPRALIGGHLDTEIFPRVETGQLQVRLRAPAGTQLEGTEERWRCGRWG